MPRRLLAAVALLLLAMACGRDPPACTVEGIHAMRRQPKYIPYDPSSFFPDGRAMRLPPDGVVERGGAEPLEVRTGVDGSGEYVRRLPLPLTAALLEEGEGHFRTVCAACHGVLGDGKSVVATKMALRPPPDLHLHRVDLAGHAAPAPAPARTPAPGGGSVASAGGVAGSLFPDVPPPAIELGDPLPTRGARIPVPSGGWTHPPGYIFAVITRGYGLMPSFAAALTPHQRWALVAHLATLQLSQQAPVDRLSAAQRRQLREGRP
jgi:mono/diheme cytochrome c family protein